MLEGLLNPLVSVTARSSEVAETGRGSIPCYGLL